MANFKQDIIEAVGDDNIIAIKFPKFECWWDDSTSKYTPANYHADTLLSYDFALTLLDYEYDAGYGSQECHDITMWSAEHIYYIHEYDGSTSICCIARNP